MRKEFGTGGLERGRGGVRGAKGSGAGPGLRDRQKKVAGLAGQTEESGRACVTDRRKLWKRLGKDGGMARMHARQQAKGKTGKADNVGKRQKKDEGKTGERHVCTHDSRLRGKTGERRKKREMHARRARCAWRVRHPMGKIGNA
eukprot:351911-Chlamydomonas_euryale.AAC.2